MKRVLTSVLCFLLLGMGCSSSPNVSREPAKRWWKGNTHTHSLWSDGNAAPEWIVDWYKGHGYHFLVLSDHNILSRGEKWFPVQGNGRLTPERVRELEDRFGPDRVTLRTKNGRKEMRLWTLDALGETFEEPGAFLLIEGEEITDLYESHEIHVNGVHLRELIPPQHGTSVRDTLNRNVNAVLEQSRRFGQPMLAHVNHPNFRWSLTWEDVASVTGDRFFEVYNGHSGVHNHGNDDHPSVERMWDLALTYRLENGLGLLYGVATDDSHDYFRWGVGRTNPGRGWVMVRAETLEPNAIVEAMGRGDFYASTGVTIENMQIDASTYRLTIAAETGVVYTTSFVGTRKGSEEVGVVLARTRANPAVYELQGDELYVRAQVVSSRAHPNPFAEGDLETAWLPPIAPLPTSQPTKSR